VVPGDCLGAHGPEVTVEPGPELLQAHDPTLTRRHPAYSGGMVPGTGSEALDVVLQIGIAVAMLVLIVLLIRNYRGR
jgi:hypothetical protein